MKPEDKLIRARVKLQNEKPFFAYLVLHLKMIEDNKMPMPTCGVDSEGNFYWDRKWINTLTEEQTKMVLCHEILHIAFLHLTRLGKRDDEVWNVACDIAVNEILDRDGFDLIPNCLNAEQFDIEDTTNKTAEEIYDILYKNHKKNGGGKGKMQKSSLRDGGSYAKGVKEGRFDKHIFGKKGQSQKEINQQKDKWTQILTEAITYAKQKGDVPAGMERFANKILRPKVNWKSLLYRFYHQNNSPRLFLFPPKQEIAGDWDLYAKHSKGRS